VSEKVLLTGATGFIGGHLAERLVGNGRPVRCLVRAGSDTSRLRELDVELVVADLRKPRSVAAAVEGCTQVLHCAALVSDWATVEEIRAANVVGTGNLLDAAVAAGVARLIHFSSTDVYGHPGARQLDEAYRPTGFANWYAQSKWEAEQKVREACEHHGLGAVIVRPATVYGPGSTDVVGEIARALRGGHMLLIDGGQHLAGLCFVENLIDAALVALDHGGAPGQAFNVSDGLPVTWRGFTDDLAEGLGCRPARWSIPYKPAAMIGHSLELAYRLLRRRTGMSTPPLLSRQAVQVLGVDQDFSTRRARELLGWEPRVGYREGLEATLGWLRAAR
jgi:nucleoside-diphosphate-sugar epimerase